MAKFIWIASFPKSGNTWLRFIIAHLLFDAEKNHEAIPAMVPDIHDWLGGLEFDWQGAFPVKTHFPYENLPPRMSSHAAIYIYRNPLDMVDSALAYLRPADAEEREDLIAQFVNNGAIEPWATILSYGAWEAHVESWMGRDHEFPFLGIRYEDMLDNPFDHVRRIAGLLGVEVDDARINKVVELCSFKSMKGVEEKELSSGSSGFFNEEMNFKEGEFRFMRSGKSGGHEVNMSKDEIERLSNRFGAVMKRRGYN